MRATHLVLLAVLASVASAEFASAQAPAFVVQPPLGVPRRLAALAVGDLNNDGIDDLAVISRGNNKISIILIDPDGSYRQGASVIVGTRLKSVGIGDFNGDGNGDLVVGTGTRNIFIVPGNGDGTFGNVRRFQRCCPGQDLVVADFDNSRPGSKFGDDFAITNPGKGDVSVFLNRNVPGGSDFLPERRLRAGRRPFNILSSDFNNDGFPDLAALNIRGSGNDVSVFINNGAASPGTFRQVANFFAGRRARSFAAGDVTGDGGLDLVIGDHGVRRQNALQFLPDLGGGFFGTGPSMRVLCQTDESDPNNQPCTLRAVQVADFTGNGRSEVATLFSGINAIRIFVGDLNGGFQVGAPIVELGPNSQFLLLGRFNDDDLPDMVVGSRNDSAVRLILNISASSGGPTNTPGTPAATATPAPPTATGGIATQTQTQTPAPCRGQGCPCSTSNGDEDCDAPWFCAVNGSVCCDTPCDIDNVSCSIPGFVGTCLPTGLPNGEECGANEQCQSGFCVDGVCCNGPCQGPNDRCDAEGNRGNCIESTPRPATATPLATITPTIRLRDLGESCTAGSQCLSSFCPAEDLVCCNQACNGPNEDCALPTRLGQCLPINLPDGEFCQVDPQCISNVCDGGICRSLPTRTATPTFNGGGNNTATPTPLKNNGQFCTGGQECESGFCAEEEQICCNEPCNGPNERCDLPSTMGICVDVNLPDGSTCTDPNQCLSRVCEGNICRPADARTPTMTRTPTPNRQPTLILARGSGCNAGDDGGGMGSLALLLAVPAVWWIGTRRTPVPVRRRVHRR